MPRQFNNFSFSFVSDLLYVKSNAEQRDDVTALASLEKQYPDLFSADFKKFIKEFEFVTEYLTHKYTVDGSVSSPDKLAPLK
jgi:hypothetical protein